MNSDSDLSCDVTPAYSSITSDSCPEYLPDNDGTNLTSSNDLLPSDSVASNITCNRIQHHRRQRRQECETSLHAFFWLPCQIPSLLSCIRLIQDRVDCDTTNRLKELTCLPDDRVIAATLLPSTEDDRIMRKNITMLVTRVLSKCFSYFEKSFSDVVVWHLKHRRY